MATKKSNSKKSKEKTIPVKIGETIGTIVGEISVKKDQIVDMASNAFDSVKTTIQNITGNKKAISKKAKKSTVKKIAPAKKVVKKVAKKAVKKAAPVKKAAEKIAKKVIKKAAPVKKAVKKVVKKIVKKAAPVKKVIKKAAKKK